VELIGKHIYRGSVIDWNFKSPRGFGGISSLKQFCGVEVLLTRGRLTPDQGKIFTSFCLYETHTNYNAKSIESSDMPVRHHPMQTLDIGHSLLDL